MKCQKNNKLLENMLFPYYEINALLMLNI